MMVLMIVGVWEGAIDDDDDDDDDGDDGDDDAILFSPILSTWKWNCFSASSKKRRSKALFCGSDE